MGDCRCNEDVEEGARDLMELNDEGANSISRKRGHHKSMFFMFDAP